MSSGRADCFHAPMAARDFQHALGVEAFGEGGIVCAASRLAIDRPLAFDASGEVRKTPTPAASSLPMSRSKADMAGRRRAKPACSRRPPTPRPTVDGHACNCRRVSCLCRRFLRMANSSARPRRAGGAHPDSVFEAALSLAARSKALMLDGVVLIRNRGARCAARCRPLLGPRDDGKKEIIEKGLAHLDMICVDGGQG